MVENIEALVAATSSIQSQRDAARAEQQRAQITQLEETVAAAKAELREKEDKFQAITKDLMSMWNFPARAHAILSHAFSRSYSRKVGTCELTNLYTFLDAAAAKDAEMAALAQKVATLEKIKSDNEASSLLLAKQFEKVTEDITVATKNFEREKQSLKNQLAVRGDNYLELRILLYL